MSLSLEVKKFINSEHSGEYVEIALPVELSVKAEAKKKPAKAEKKADIDDIDDIDNDIDDVDDIDDEIDAKAKPDAKPDAKADAKAEAEPAPEPEPEKPLVEYEKVRIHYMEAGMGEPMLLIHSVGQSLYTWRGVFNKLSACYRVIAVDLPGFGYSDRPEAFGFGVEDYADVIGMFMDAIGVESAHIAAFSMGAVYALSFAMMHPERVGRMVLLAPGGITQEMPLAIRLIDSTLFGFAASMLYGIKTVEKALNDAVFDLTNITPDVVQEYYRPISDALSRRSVRRAVQYFDEEPVIARLRNIDIPVLILAGGEDKWRAAKSPEMELYHSALSSGAFSVIRNAGHLMHEEKPDRVAEAIFEFIPAAVPEV